MPLISIIVPVYNEEKNLELFYSQVKNLPCFSEHTFEMIFVNDGSNDSSTEILYTLAQNDKRVKFVELTRNFGQQAALTAGLDHCSGDAIITIDCDFQDPPELIPDMIKEWEKGFDIVYMRRKIRKEGFFKRLNAKMYYSLLYRFSDIKIKGNIGEFRLINKKVLFELNKMREKSRYLRGMIPWLGHKFTIIDFDRPLRGAGQTGFSFLKMARLGMNGILSFSLIPLRLGLLVGIFIVFTGIVFMIYLALNYLINNQFYKLLEWLAVANYIMIGFLFILLWIIGEYIGKIYNETKNRPIYVIENKANLNSDENPDA